MLISFGALSIVPYLQQPPVPGSLCIEVDTDFLEYRYDEQIPVCARNIESAKKNQWIAQISIVFIWNGLLKITDDLK